MFEGIRAARDISGDSRSEAIPTRYEHIQLKLERARGFRFRTIELSFTPCAISFYIASLSLSSRCYAAFQTTFSHYTLYDVARKRELTMKNLFSRRMNAKCQAFFPRLYTLVSVYARFIALYTDRRKKKWRARAATDG